MVEGFSMTAFERRDFMLELAWYWWAAIIAAVGAFVYYFWVK